MSRLAVTLSVWAVLAAVPASAQTQPAAVDYERDVRPILAAHCFGCHGPRQQQSGLRLDLRQNALRGGDYGVVIVPGKAAESKLIKRLTGSEAGVQMPPTGPLPQHEIDVLRAWIDAGADMPGRALETAAVGTRDESGRSAADRRDCRPRSRRGLKTHARGRQDPREGGGRRRIDRLDARRRERNRRRSCRRWSTRAPT